MLMNFDLDVLFNDVLSSVKNNKSYLISLIGAGGKTSTLFWLAQRFSQQGLSVLITTTTHMYRPEPSQAQTIIEKEDWHALLTHQKASSSTPKIVALFTEYNAATHKVSGITPEQADMLQAAQLFDVILVEADGAHQQLLKAPAGHEPCIPQSSKCVIALTGGLVINNPADPEQIHRWPIFADLCGIKAGDRLNISVFERFIAHPDGMFKGTPPHALRVWFINRLYQIDNALLGSLTALLKARPELSTIWIGAVQESPPITHQLCQSQTT